MNGSYNPNKSQISNHLEFFNRLLDEHNKKCKNYVLVGDFNLNTSDGSMNLKWVSKNARPILLFTGTKKAMAIMPLDLKFKAFVL